jgi:hypothetical protein
MVTVSSSFSPTCAKIPSRQKNEQQVKDIRRQNGAAGPGPCRSPAAGRFFFSDFSVSVFQRFSFCFRNT